jgi:hypothetical protein
LAKAGDDRASILLGCRLRNLANFLGVARGAQKYGVDPDPDTTRVQLEAERDRIISYAEARGFSTNRAFPDDKQMAEWYGREQSFVEYRCRHYVVHRTTAALDSRMRGGRAEEVVEIGPYGDDKDYLDAVAGFACHSAMHARLAAGQVFGWEEPAGLRDLSAAFERDRATHGRI